jgi:hypothetical protein
MAVAVDIQAGYPRGSIGPEQGSITVRGKVAWSDVGNKLNELFPGATTSSPGASALDPLLGLYRCQSCEFEPVASDPDVKAGGTPFFSPYDADFKLPFYDLAWLTITYSSVQVEFPNAANGDGGGAPDRPNGSSDLLGLVHQLSSAGEVITLDQSSLMWSDGVSPSGTSVTAHKIIPTIEHNIQWKRVLSPPWEAMRTLLGKVNNMDLGPFQTGTMLEETLLYLGFTASPDIKADGTRVWDIGYKFSERRIDDLTKASEGGAVTPDGITGYTSQYGGWNHFYKQEEDEVAAGANAKTSGFRRLHARTPAAFAPADPNYYDYVDDAAVFKKGALETLFVQV